jgi:hypothetical protein
MLSNHNAQHNNAAYIAIRLALDLANDPKGAMAYQH